MSKADKMFRSLRFIEKDSFGNSTYRYEDDDNFEVTFYDDDEQKYEVFYYNANPIPEKDWHLDANNYNVVMSMDLHLAIHEKLKELGWI